MLFAIFISLAEEERESFMKKQITSYGIPHEVTRANLYEDAIALYREEGENIMQEYPFRIKFKGEKAVDCGGVSRDMLSGFWEVAYQTVSSSWTILISPLPHPG